MVQGRRGAQSAEGGVTPLESSLEGQGLPQLVALISLGSRPTRQLHFLVHVGQRQMRADGLQLDAVAEPIGFGEQPAAIGLAEEVLDMRLVLRDQPG